MSCHQQVTQDTQRPASQKSENQTLCNSSSIYLLHVFLVVCPSPTQHLAKTNVKAWELPLRLKLMHGYNNTVHRHRTTYNIYSTTLQGSSATSYRLHCKKLRKSFLFPFPLPLPSIRLSCTNCSHMHQSVIAHMYVINIGY